MCHCVRMAHLHIRYITYIHHTLGSRHINLAVLDEVHIKRRPHRPIGRCGSGIAENDASPFKQQNSP